MEDTEHAQSHPEPAKPNQDAGQREQDPKVPPASETWVEGQPTSDADYEK